MESLVHFREWLFAVDADRTISVHKQLEKGGADTCGCDNCKNYALQRDQVFPSEVRTLLANLGVDYRKEAEVSHFGRLNDGMHMYHGWFHFKGRIASGRDCTVPQGRDGYTVDTVRVGDHFRIGFIKQNHLNSFAAEEANELVQVEFSTVLPWKLVGVPETI
jgi:hypothetical protein